MRRFPLALLVLAFGYAHLTASDPFIKQAATQDSAPDGAKDVFSLNITVRLVEIPVLWRSPASAAFQHMMVLYEIDEHFPLPKLFMPPILSTASEFSLPWILHL